MPPRRAKPAPDTASALLLQPSGRSEAQRISRVETLSVVGVTAALWLLNSHFILLRPILWLTTFVHEAMHAVAAMLCGKSVSSVTINKYGGGLAYAEGGRSTFQTIVIASAGYVGAAIVGAIALEFCKRLRSARVACVGVAVLLVTVGLLWVPWRFNPTGASALFTRSTSGDGRFTTIFWIVGAAFFIAIAVLPVRRLRRWVLLVVATALCLLSVEQLKHSLDWTARGGDNDASAVAAVTPLSSWMWSAIWLLFGAAICVLALWSLASDQRRKAETPLTEWRAPTGA